MSQPLYGNIMSSPVSPTFRFPLSPARISDEFMTAVAVTLARLGDNELFRGASNGAQCFKRSVVSKLVAQQIFLTLSNQETSDERKNRALKGYTSCVQQLRDAWSDFFAQYGLYTRRLQEMLNDDAGAPQPTINELRELLQQLTILVDYVDHFRLIMTRGATETSVAADKWKQLMELKIQAKGSLQVHRIERMPDVNQYVREFLVRANKNDYAGSWNNLIDTVGKDLCQSYDSAMFDATNQCEDTREFYSSFQSMLEEFKNKLNDKDVNDYLENFHAQVREESGLWERYAEDPRKYSDKSSSEDCRLAADFFAMYCWREASTKNPSPLGSPLGPIFAGVGSLFQKAWASVSSPPSPSIP